ncbi:NIPSNAP family protein [Enterovibrio coralii]|uniref:NIPSNAP family containing protein n=1 Tax=Enterovibrio coralii TaxID=294935 RepID=A0A135I525_9GAMM|nr:NIPSNAP family protein [Enterovibrio coralii]KXF80556.1 NIPSNAP family containing protein [Enterovibrio coralii]
MITCYVRYVIDPKKTKEFEDYARMWIPLVEKFGGKHNGYFLPSEGANNVALALFTFESLTAYETYRIDSLKDPECQEAFKFAEQTDCILSYERSFFRPVFGE